MSRVLCVGVGHVGLPLSLKLWAAGHDVTPLDLDESKIDALRRGLMPFVEPGCEELLAVAAGDPRFVPLTYDDQCFGERTGSSEYIVMTLGTPLGGEEGLRFDQYYAAMDRLVPFLSRGVTLIVRSTVVPGFTRDGVAERIAAQRGWSMGRDFFASFCPERLMQGTALRDIDDLPEIIGADDPETATRADALFRSLGPHKRCIHVSTVEAELTKLFLNAFRYALFGLANEYALCAERYGADIAAILGAANSDYPRGGIPRPGPSKGPCLGKDTAALAGGPEPSLIAQATLRANEKVIDHVVDVLASELGGLTGRKVGVLGLAFKAGTDDVRDNMSVPLLELLSSRGAITAVYDPLVRSCAEPSVLAGSDAIVLMTAHEELRVWDQADIVQHCRRERESIYVFDLWNAWPWADRIFGRGESRAHEDSRDRGVRLAHAGSYSPTA